MYDQQRAAHPVKKDKLAAVPTHRIDTGTGGGGASGWKPLFSPAASRSSLLTGATDPMTRGNSILTRDPSTNGIVHPNNAAIVPLSHMPTIPSGREDDWAAALDKLATHEQADPALTAAGDVSRKGSEMVIEELSTHGTQKQPKKKGDDDDDDEGVA